MLQFAKGSFIKDQPSMELKSSNKRIMEVINQYRSVFPHVRGDKMMKRIAEGCAVWDEGVVITFTKYKRSNTVGGVKCASGDIMIHQIAAKTQGDGSAGRVLSKFIEYSQSTGARNIYLTVRSENERAISFYKKNGFEVVGEVSWKRGTIPGVVMGLPIGEEVLEKFFD